MILDHQILVEYVMGDYLYSGYARALMRGIDGYKLLVADDIDGPAEWLDLMDVFPSEDLFELIEHVKTFSLLEEE